MRIVAVVLALASLASLVLAPLSCESTSSPSGSDGGSTIPTEDGAICSCGTPDCLPNCSDLPACKLECVSDGSAVRINWVDPCGNTQFTQACPNGCTDAATPQCQ